MSVVCAVCRENGTVTSAQRLFSVEWQCPICLSTFNNTLNANAMSCGHLYCIDCFDRMQMSTTVIDMQEMYIENSNVIRIVHNVQNDYSIPERLPMMFGFHSLNLQLGLNSPRPVYEWRLLPVASFIHANVPTWGVYSTRENRYVGRDVLPDEPIVNFFPGEPQVLATPSGYWRMHFGHADVDLSIALNQFMTANPWLNVPPLPLFFGSSN